MRRTIFFIITAAVACLATVGLYGSWGRQEDSNMQSAPRGSIRNAEDDPNIIRFIPIGDSYTIGLGVPNEEDRWPNLLVKSLEKEGINVELVVNPAVSGYEVEDAIARELPVFEKEKPDFGTLFIGANDAFRQGNLNRFKENYAYLVDRMQSALTSKNNLVVITIPNYARFPAGVRYGYSEAEEKVIEQYNKVIREEAGKRNLRVVDLFQINSMNSMEYFISDGLHPNAKGIKVWHDQILSVVKETLKSPSP